MLKNFYLGILFCVSLFLIPLFVFSQEENLSFKFLSSLNEKIDRIISQLDELKNTLAQVSALATNKKLRLYTSGSGVIDFYPSGTSCGTDCRSYPTGTQVTLTARPSQGYYFEKWGYDCASFSTTVCQLIMDQDRKAKAYFKRGSNVQYQLSVSVSGQGKVTGPGIDCGSDCTEIYSAGTSLNLSAIPNYGQQFLGWSGDCSGTNSTCYLKMDSNKNVSASFSGGGGGTQKPPVIVRFGASSSNFSSSNVSSFNTSSSNVSISTSSNSTYISNEECVLLSWEVVNADRCSGSINAIGSITPSRGTLEGGVFVCPQATTTYTLTCSNAAGSSSANLTIKKEPEPIELDFPNEGFSCKEALASMDSPSGTTVFSALTKRFKPEKISIKIQDLIGNVVFRQDNISGNYFIWNGKNTSGKQVANGVYFFSMSVNKGGKIVNCPLSKFYYLK
jgi:hypothetical protein